MRIVVLVKQVPDTWDERVLDPVTGFVDRGASERVVDEIGERAVEAALAYKDGAKDTEVVVLTMGPEPATDALRKTLAMGADSAVHVVDDALAGSDLLRTARALAAALERIGFDLVITGNESTDGRGGVIPAMLAELLGLPALLNLDAVTIGSADVTGDRAAEDARRTLRAPLPAVVSITERSDDPRFPGLKGVMGAKKKPLSRLTLPELGLERDAVASVMVSASRRPARSSGTIVADDGTAAGQLVDFLVAQRLV